MAGVRLSPSSSSGISVDSGSRTTPSANEFVLAPCLPSDLLSGRGEYSLSKLRFRGVSLTVTLTPEGSGNVRSTVRFAAETPVTLRILDQRTGSEVTQSTRGREGSIALAGTNGRAYRIQMVY